MKVPTNDETIPLNPFTIVELLTALLIYSFYI
jgi:hypothetical protein